MPSFRKLLDGYLKESGFQETPGAMVRVHRKRFGLTLKELEEVTGIRESNLSAIENDKITMTPHYAEIFAVTFGMHPIEFLYPQGEPEQTTELTAVGKRMDKYIKRGFQEPTKKGRAVVARVRARVKKTKAV